MAPVSGNAVAAEWIGPAGQQLFDGTVLNPGSVVVGVGKDEAEGSDYWKVLGPVESYDAPEGAADVSAIREDPSFGTEEGGEGTGRPLTEDQVADDSKPSPKPKKSSSTSPADPDTSTTEGEVSV